LRRHASGHNPDHGLLKADPLGPLPMSIPACAKGYPPLRRKEPRFEELAPSEGNVKR
jgi:hypothetical protein